MANSLAAVESALRARKLDRTLTTALPPLERTDPSSLVPTGIAPLDDLLAGGFPRGQLSEIAARGPAAGVIRTARTAGLTTTLLQTMAAVTRRGELAALIDASDRLDVASAAAAGIDLERLLWVRGGGGPPDTTAERAVKALNLVLQARGFAFVALDLADVPPVVLKRLPFTTWLRLQRSVEGSDTACVVVAPEPLARSAGGLTVSLAASSRWAGAGDRSCRLEGLDVSVRVISSRRRVEREVRIGAAAHAG
jgi:hypothetical protein